MTPHHQSIADLLKAYMEDRNNPQLQQRLSEYLENEALQPDVQQALALLLEEQKGEATELDAEHYEALFEKIVGVDRPVRVARLHVKWHINKYWMRYAAAVLMLVLAGTYVWNELGKTPEQIPAELHADISKDIDPGKEGAILVLDDGTEVVLDDREDGVIDSAKGVKVVLRNGEISYLPIDGNAIVPTYHTMYTPKGRQFNLVLPDGSRVWLNASSSIRFPTAFRADSREVDITGELYFEIAKAGLPGTPQPFRVNIGEQTAVEVLGTHFNINAYLNEENIQTTLLQGSVQVVNQSKSIVLRPGEQASLSRANAKAEMKVSRADINRVMAWKNGIFDFEDATLEEVMRQLERWYDIEVVYEKGIPKLEFYGTMGRDLSLATVLRGLEISKVKFRIEEGRRLIVLP